MPGEWSIGKTAVELARGLGDSGQDQVAEHAVPVGRGVKAESKNSFMRSTRIRIFMPNKYKTAQDFD